MEIKTLRAALKHKEDDLETAQFSSTEAQAEASQAVERALAAQEAAREAEERERRAVAALDAVRGEASKVTFCPPSSSLPPCLPFLLPLFSLPPSLLSLSPPLSLLSSYI